MFVRCLFCTYKCVVLTVFNHYHYGYCKAFCRHAYIITLCLYAVVRGVFTPCAQDDFSNTSYILCVLCLRIYQLVYYIRTGITIWPFLFLFKMTIIKFNLHLLLLHLIIYSLLGHYVCLMCVLYVHVYSHVIVHVRFYIL